MKAWAALSLTWQDLRFDAWRSLLTMANLALLAAIYLAVAALSAALENARDPQLTTSNNLLLLEANILDPMDSSLEPAVLDWAETSARQAFGAGAVSAPAPLILRHMRIEGQVLQVAAAAPEQMGPLFQLELLSGAWPNAAPVPGPETGGEIVVSQGVLDLIDSHPGETFKIYGQPFTITGLITAPGNRAAVWMPYATAVELFSAQRGFQVGVLPVASNFDPGTIQSHLEQDPQNVGQYAVYLEQQFSAQFSQSVADMFKLADVSRLLALLVITFGAYQNAHLTLTERRVHLATLRTLGFDALTTGAILLLRSWLLALGAYPLAVGLVFAYLQVGFQRRLVLFDTPLRLELTPQLLTSGLALTLIFISLGVWLSLLAQNRRSVQVQGQA